MLLLVRVLCPHTEEVIVVESHLSECDDWQIGENNELPPAEVVHDVPPISWEGNSHPVVCLIRCHFANWGKLVVRGLGSAELDQVLVTFIGARLGSSRSLMETRHAGFPADHLRAHVLKSYKPVLRKWSVHFHFITNQNSLAVVRHFED